MGVIQEELRLADQFSQTFRNFDVAANASINVAEEFQKALNGFSEGFLDGLINSLQDSRDELGRMVGEADDVKNAYKGVESIISRTTGNINDNTDAQDRFNESVQKSEKSAASLMGTISKIAGAIGVVKLAENFVETADEMSQITAKLNLINDGFMTTEQLQSAIYNSAQRTRSSYQDTAQLVARIGMNTGDTFKSNVEIVKFAENLNKSFKIAGASAQEQSSVILQLSQALAGGLLRGQEFNAVMSGAPNIIKNIANYMGVTVGEMRDLAAEGQITSDIIREAMLGATDEINAQFNTLPQTFGDVMATAKNKITVSLNSAFEEWINKLNGGDVQGAIDKVTDAIVKLAEIGADALMDIVDATTWVIDNFEKIEPVLKGAGAAVLTYKALHIKAAEETATKWGAVNTVIGKVSAAIGLVVGAWSLLNNKMDESDAVNNARESGLLDGLDSISRYGAEVGTYVNSVGMMQGSTKGLYDVLGGSKVSDSTVYNAASGIPVTTDEWIVRNVPFLGDIFKQIRDWQYESDYGMSYYEYYSDQKLKRIQAEKDAEAELLAKEAELAEREAERLANATAWYNSYYGSRYTPDDEGFAAVAKANRDQQLLWEMYKVEYALNHPPEKVGGETVPVKVVDSVKLSDEDLQIFRDIAENRYIANVSLETLAPSVSVNVENNGQNLSEDDIATAVTRAIETQISERTAISHG